MSLATNHPALHAWPPGHEPTWEIALLYPPQGRWTVSDYWELSERFNQLVEFTRGRIEVLEPPTIEHQLIVGFLLKQLRQSAFDGERGLAIMAPHQTTILPDVVREPDIVYKLRENLPSPDEKYFTGADLIMEVVGADERSRRRDYQTKVADYAKAGVAEYWIFDPQEERVMVLSLAGDKYAEHADLTKQGTATSVLLDGFAVDVTEVFAAGKA